MSAHEKLATVPSDPRTRELWLQHLAGHVILRDVRDYARSRIDPKLAESARTAAEKAIDDAVYGLMMLIDGVTDAPASPTHQVEVRCSVVLRSLADQHVVQTIDLREGDGMCMGFHAWKDGDFGQTPLFE